MAYRGRWNRGNYINQIWDEMGSSAPPAEYNEGAVPESGAVPGKGAVEAEVVGIERPKKKNCYVDTPSTGLFDRYSPSDIRGALGPAMTAVPMGTGNDDIYVLYGYFWKTPANKMKFGASCGVGREEQPGGSNKHIGLRGSLIDARDRAAWRNLV